MPRPGQGVGAAHCTAHPDGAGADIVQGEAAGGYQEGEVPFPELYSTGRDLPCLPDAAPPSLPVPPRRTQNEEHGPGHPHPALCHPGAALGA